MLIFLSMLESDEERRLFTDLYNQYGNMMLHVAKRYFPKDMYAAEDVVQNAWIRVVDHFQKIQAVPSKKRGAYLVVIVRNEAITALRKQKPELQFDENFVEGYAICGILGNMNSESTINPAVWQSLNDMYLGYGLVQWDDGKLFIDWAKKEGVISAATAEAVNSLAYSNPKKLMDAELDYLIVSMNTVGNWFKPDNNQSKYGTSETLTASQFKVSNKSADILARIFCGHYERPGVPKISERVANAKKWYNFL